MGEASMAEWADRYWTSADGLQLHYRDYAGPRDRPPILCLPGLTRNARDFEPVADRYAGRMARASRRSARARRQRLRPRPGQLHAADLCRRRAEAARPARHRRRGVRRHVARRARHHAARRDRRTSGSPARCSTTSGRRSTRPGSSASAAMSGRRRASPRGTRRLAALATRNADVYPAYGARAMGALRPPHLPRATRAGSASTMTWRSPTISIAPRASRRSTPGRSIDALAGRPVTDPARRAERPARAEVARRDGRRRCPMPNWSRCPTSATRPTLDEPESDRRRSTGCSSGCWRASRQSA